MIVKIIFNNYLLLNEIELVHSLFTFTNKHTGYYLMPLINLYGFSPERLFNNFLPEYYTHNLRSDLIRLPAIKCEFGTVTRTSKPQ